MNTCLKHASLTLCAGILMFSAADLLADNRNPPKTKMTLDDARRQYEVNCPGNGCTAQCTEISAGKFSCTCSGAECGRKKLRGTPGACE